MNRLLCSTLPKSFGYLQPLERSILANHLEHRLHTLPVALLQKSYPNNNSSASSNKSTSATKKFTPKTQNKTSPKITLIATNQSLSVTSLEEAQKLAKRRDLHLLQVQQYDAKTQRAVYKLATAAELLSDETEDQRNVKDKNTAKKSEKSLTIGARISEHDLASRLKNINKWLLKRHDVHILLQGGGSADQSSCDKIIKTIEHSIVEPQLIGKIMQKRSKGSVIKFIILPVTTTTEPAAAASTTTATTPAAPRQTQA